MWRGSPAFQPCSHCRTSGHLHRPCDDERSCRKVLTTSLWQPSEDRALDVGFLGNGVKFAKADDSPKLPHRASVDLCSCPCCVTMAISSCPSLCLDIYKMILNSFLCLMAWAVLIHWCGDCFKSGGAQGSGYFLLFNRNLIPQKDVSVLPWVCTAGV